MNSADIKFIEKCTSVLNQNLRDGYTTPAKNLYPHQWLWDSCFTAIGLRHFDIERAKNELILLKRGAWSNGMLPNIIFNDDFLSFDHLLWQSKLRREAPRKVNTTGITQPPMLAEAVVKVGEKMSAKDRTEWYGSMFDYLVNYHQWLYFERDPSRDGLTVQLHPYESGLDNSPPWMYLLNKTRYPWWVKFASGHTFKVIINHFRRDTKFIPASQRIGLKDALKCFYAIRKLTGNQYKFEPNPAKNQLAMQDLTFNCIFIRANKHLVDIANEINQQVPPSLLESMHKTEDSLEKLWSAENQQYYSRNYYTKRLLKLNTIATFMPLYAGCISRERAKLLVDLLAKSANKPDYPVPSVPTDSPHFKPHKYWQGPAWLNSNWLIIQGLREYGYAEEAEELAHISVKLVENNGPYEYFSALEGSPLGVKDFSWSASLAIDLKVEFSGGTTKN